MVPSSWSSSLRPRSRFEWKLFLTLFSVLVYVKSEQTQTLEKAFQYKTFRLLWNFLHDDRFGASVQLAWNCRIFLKDNMTSMPVTENRSVSRSNPRSNFSTNKIKNSLPDLPTVQRVWSTTLHYSAQSVYLSVTGI